MHFLRRTFNAFNKIPKLLQLLMVARADQPTASPRRIFYYVSALLCNSFIKNNVAQYSTIPTLAVIAGMNRPAISTTSPRLDDDADVEDNITHLIILAKIALEKGDRERAEAILDIGLKLCEEKNIVFGVPFMYDILATIALANGELEKAETLLATVIEKMTKTGTPEDNHHIVDFKLRLARIYSTYREYELAEVGFKTCLEAQKQKILDGDVSTKTGMLYVNVLFWYGIHKIRNAHYTGAKRLLDTAYDYSAKIKGLSPYQEMVILYTLADLNLELGEYNVALMNMQNAVMLGKGIGSADLPRCYVKLAKIYLKMEVYDQAKNAAQEGVKLASIFSNNDVVEDGNEVLRNISQIIKN